MKSVKFLPSIVSLVVCLGISPISSAATIAPANAAFTAPGTIVVSSPASLQIPVTCNVTFKGRTSADGRSASIDSVTVSDSNLLCSVPQMTGLPWKLTVSSTTADQVTGVGFKILASTCGPSTIRGSWSNATNTLSGSNQPLSGNCKINNLSVKPSPAFTVSP